MTTTQSESIANLAAALVAAQSQMGGAKKSSANPYFKSKYADLSECLDVASKPLADNGLAVTQSPMTELVDGSTMAGVETMVIHESGEWLKSKLLLTPTKLDPQQIGSAITYARRYSLASILGIAQEDDDGESHRQPLAQPAKLFDEFSVLFDKKDFDSDKFFKAFSIKKCDDLKSDPAKLQQAINALKKKADK